MNNRNDQKLKDRAKAKLTDWKASVEHLNVQLHLGAAEAREEFEKQKKNIGSWLDIIEDKLKNTKDLGTEKALKLKTSLEELRVQAALGKAESEDVMYEQVKNINKGIHNLKHNLNQTIDASEEEFHELSEKSHDRLDDFHTRFDLFRLRAHLGKKEVEETWEDKKKELATKLHELDNNLDKSKHAASEKWEHFTEEVSESWKVLKNAFKS